MFIVPLKVSCIVFSIASIILWYIFSCKCFIWVDLAHACTMLWLHISHFKPLWSFSFLACISLYALINMFCRYAWLWPLCSLSWSHPSLLLAFICTEYDLYSCIQPPKTKFAKRVHHIYLFVVFHCHSTVVCSCVTFKTF